MVRGHAIYARNPVVRDSDMNRTAFAVPHKRWQYSDTTSHLPQRYITEFWSLCLTFQVLAMM